ncbi:MAG: hypothetical protein RML94_13610 [Bacteroidia bacterium]|nr:hypothetical protein [Bacteroidia bacterium]
MLSISTLGQTNFAYTKNAIQYQDFVWKYLKTDNFYIYFTQKNDSLAHFVALEAEKHYAYLYKMMDYYPETKIALIVHASITDFLQSNIQTPNIKSPEGGITEMIPTKCEVYFEGSYFKFAHQIRRNLCLTFFNDMMFGGSLPNTIQSSLFLSVPAWFSEGLAEYLAEGWNDTYAYHTRDAILNKRIHSFMDIQGQYADKIGVSVWHFIAQQYSSDRIADILYMVRSSRNVLHGIEYILNINTPTLFNDYLTFYQKKFESGKQNFENKDNYTFIQQTGNMSISPDGTHLAYTTHHKGIIKVWVKNLQTQKKHLVIQTGMRTDVTDLSFWTLPLAWSNEGNKLAVAYSDKGKTRLLLYDKNTQSKKNIKTGGLKQILSIDWSSDNTQLLLAAVKNAQSDIFILPIGGSIRQITNTKFDDISACFSTNDNEIWICSNQPDPQDEDLPYFGLTAPEANPNFNLWRLQIDNEGKIKNTLPLNRIINRRYDQELHPQVIQDKLTFTTNKNGIFNVLYIPLQELKNTNDTLQINPRYLTNLPSDAISYAITYDFKSLYVSQLYDGVIQLFYKQIDDKTQINTKIQPTEEKIQYITQKRLEIQRNKLLNVKNEIDKIIDTTENKKRTINYNHYVFDYQKQEFVLSNRPKKQDKRGYQSVKITSQQSQKTVNISPSQMYIVSMSPDVVGTGLCTDPVKGVGIQLVGGMSDVFNNYKITAAARLYFDFRSTDYIIKYLYQPKKWDYLIEFNRRTRDFRDRDDLNDPFVLKYKTYTLKSTAIRPYSRFLKWETQGEYTHINRQNLVEIPKPDERCNIIGVGTRIVYDNAKLKGLNIPQGTRAGIGLNVYQSIFDTPYNLATFSGEIKHYTVISGEFIWASRIATQWSLGSNPQLFYLGGVDGYINNRIENHQGLRYRNPQAADFYFTDFATPMRGFIRGARTGRRYILWNNELRIPLLKYVKRNTIPSALWYNLQLAAFVDVGTAWNRGFPNRNNAELNTAYYELGNISAQVFNQRSPWVMGYGMGIRTVLLGYFLRIDVSWGVEDGYANPRALWTFAIGTDF